MHFCSTPAAAKSLQSCPTLCDPIDGSPPGSPIPGILQARTRVGCHFLLQCVQVKSESEVAQSCPTCSDPMACSPPGPSVHGIFQARGLEWGATAFSILHTANPRICSSHGIFISSVSLGPQSSTTNLTWLPGLSQIPGIHPLPRCSLVTPSEHHFCGLCTC